MSESPLDAALERRLAAAAPPLPAGLRSRVLRSAAARPTEITRSPESRSHADGRRLTTLLVSAFAVLLWMNLTVVITSLAAARPITPVGNASTDSDGLRAGDLRELLAASALAPDPGR